MRSLATVAAVLMALAAAGQPELPKGPAVVLRSPKDEVFRASLKLAAPAPRVWRLAWDWSPEFATNWARVQFEIERSPTIRPLSWSRYALVRTNAAGLSTTNVSGFFRVRAGWTDTGEWSAWNQ